MANVIETMCCEIAFRLDGGDLGFLCVGGMKADRGII